MVPCGRKSRKREEKGGGWGAEREEEAGKAEQQPEAGGRPFRVVVVQLPSHVRLFATPWIAAQQAPLAFTVSQS